MSRYAAKGLRGRTFALSVVTLAAIIVTCTCLLRWLNLPLDTTRTANTATDIAAADTAAAAQTATDIAATTKHAPSSVAASVSSSGVVQLTLHGLPQRTIRIQLRKDLSREASSWISLLAQHSSEPHTHSFYRAEPGFLLQGSLKSKTLPQMPPHKGPCPHGVNQKDYRKSRPCYAHDPDCGCHGPIMQPGMVGWAGGAGSGPDFFIYVGKTPAQHWSHDHTVWGELADRESFEAVTAVLALPTEGSGMKMLRDALSFDLTSAVQGQGQLQYLEDVIV